MPFRQCPEPLQAADDDGHDLCLGDLLACRRDDPATDAGRRLDWDEFLVTQDSRDRSIIHDLAMGNALKSTAARLKISPPRITQLKDEIGKEIRYQMGDQILLEVADEPIWRRSNRAHAGKIV